VSNMASDAAPGTGGGQVGQQPLPPAGESNADNAATGPPETIPYARFKEVNEELSSLKGYAQLRDWGYDPDSLGRLAQFETAYMQDPAGVVAQLAENLDLPPEVMEAIKASSEDSDTPVGNSGFSGAAEGEPSETETTDTTSPELKYLLERERKREEEERRIADSAQADAEQQAADNLLQQVLSHWNKLDTQDGVNFSEEQKLTYIAAVGGAGAYNTAEEMAEASRQTAMAHREDILGGAVRSRPTTGSPLTVPGGASTASAPANFGGDIAAATKAAKAAIERGELPGG
jgi:hypothetical protein